MESTGNSAFAGSPDGGVSSSIHSGDGAMRFVHHPYAYVVVSGLAIALTVAACSMLAPDLVTGQEAAHYSLGAFASWFGGAVAFGLVLAAVARRADDDPQPWAALALVVVAIWVAVAAVSILAPSLVIGSDPTTIPMASLLAPIAGAIGTAFACVFAASSTND